MRWLANVAYLLAGLVYLPILLYQAVVLGKNRRGWIERLGGVRRRSTPSQCVWIHAVSLGEINCTPRLVDALRLLLPRLDIIVSTTTDTGFARAVELYGRDHVMRFPLDFSPIIARVLRRVQPSLIVLVELEVWHNLVRMASARGIPVVVVNGRLTARSARRLRKLGGLARPMFGDLAWVGAQDATIGARFQSVGVPAERIEVTSSLKWDTATVTDEVDAANALALAVGIDGSRPVWVCGSTGPGEEALILGAFRRLLDVWPTTARSRSDAQPKGGHMNPPVLVLVPRKPERFDEVAGLIARSGCTSLRRSEHGDATTPATGTDSQVILGDTMGELRKFYALADVVLVGRTLVPMGGSDPMEVAALGKAIVVGPHTDNFALPVQALATAEAIRVVHTPEELTAEIQSLLVDPDRAKALGQRARAVVIENQGATDRTAEAIASLLTESESSREEPTVPLANAK